MAEMIQHFFALHVEDRQCLNCGWDYCAHRHNLECPRGTPPDPIIHWDAELIESIRRLDDKNG